MKYNNLCTWAEIDLDALINNFEILSEYVPDGMKKLAVIKADAYGHGAVYVANHLENRVDYFGVARADEGLELRACGIKTKILILGHTSPDYYQTLIKNSLIPTVYNRKEAMELDRVACGLGVSAPIHIAVDTGMSRIGFELSEESINDICCISKLENITVEGIFSHLANADDLADRSFTDLQLERFRRFVTELETNGVCIPLRHLYNSAGICSLEPDFNMVRMGICLYGHLPDSAFDVKNTEKLRPVMSLRSEVIHIHEIEPDTPVGYNCTFVSRKKMKIATVCAGYADGYPRLISGKADVLINGKRAKVLGRICMDQFMCDITDIDGVEIGTVVTLFGKDGENEISALEIARLAETNTYEILCGISKRVPRVYLKCNETADVHFGIPHDSDC